MTDTHEPYEHDNCYVVECPEANIIAVTSDHDLGYSMFESLGKQHQCVHISEYRDVDVTYFIAAKDTSLAHKVDEFVNELREKGDAFDD